MKVFYYRRDTSTVLCVCVTALSMTIKQDCSTTNGKVYVRAIPPPVAPPSEPSNTSGRRCAAARRRAAEEDTSLCPASLTACKIEGSVDCYEVGPFSSLLSPTATNG